MDGKSLLLGISFAIIWSSAFSSAKLIVTDASPLYALAFRFTISGIIAVIWGLLRGETAHFSKKQWIAIITFGICQNTLYLGLNFVAAQNLHASVNSVIASTMPLIVATFGLVFLSQKVTPKLLIGLTLGYLGVCAIMLPRFQGDLNIFSVFLCVIAVFALSIATLSLKNATKSGGIFMVIGLQMLIGAFALGVVAFIIEEPRLNQTNTLLFAFTYTTLIPGLIATIIWFKLVERVGAIKASAFHFLNPVLGVAFAWSLLNEPVNWADAIGVSIVAIGVLLVQTNQKTS